MVLGYPTVLRGRLRRALRRALEYRPQAQTGRVIYQSGVEYAPGEAVAGDPHADGRRGAGGGEGSAGHDGGVYYSPSSEIRDPVIHPAGSPPQ